MVLPLWQRYEEAAHHFLDAIALQEAESVRDDPSVIGAKSGRGVTSSSLWESLKTTCIHMKRPDMATMCDAMDLDGSFFALLSDRKRTQRGIHV